MRERTVGPVPVGVGDVEVVAEQPGGERSPEGAVARARRTASSGPSSHTLAIGSPVGVRHGRNSSSSAAITQNDGTTSSRNCSYWSSPQITTASGANVVELGADPLATVDERGPVRGGRRAAVEVELGAHPRPASPRPP